MTENRLIPTEAQRKVLCDMIAVAFVEMRLLSNRDRMADLADVFHNVPAGMPFPSHFPSISSPFLLYSQVERGRPMGPNITFLKSQPPHSSALPPPLQNATACYNFSIAPKPAGAHSVPLARKAQNQPTTP